MYGIYIGKVLTKLYEEPWNYQNLRTILILDR